MHKAPVWALEKLLKIVPLNLFHQACVRTHKHQL
jgi:hypothetical protein